MGYPVRNDCNHQPLSTKAHCDANYRYTNGKQTARTCLTCQTCYHKRSPSGIQNILVNWPVAKLNRGDNGPELAKFVGEASEQPGSKWSDLASTGHGFAIEDLCDQFHVEIIPVRTSISVWRLLHGFNSGGPIWAVTAVLIQRTSHVEWYILRLLKPGYVQMLRRETLTIIQFHPFWC